MSRDNVSTIEEPDRVVKAGDPDGIYGTTARYWINQHLPALARQHLGGKGRRILDLGCGDGPNARVLADAGVDGEYLGVDLAASPLWTERAGRRNALSIGFVAHDAHQLDQLDGQFDGLVSVSAFEHFRDERLVIEGLGRRLAPGARGIVIVPSRYGNLVWGFRHGYRTYTPGQFARTLDGSLLRLVEAIPSGGLPSLVANSAWRGASLSVTYAVLALMWARHLGDRAAAKRASPWISTLAGTVQYRHLESDAGRAFHRAANRRLLDLDERAPPGFPTQWAFVIERR